MVKKNAGKKPDDFKVIAPFTVKSAEIKDEPNDSILIIEGYCNWSGNDVNGQTYTDLAGDVVVPFGVDASVWQINPVILWQHDRDDVIGKGLLLEKRQDGLYLKAEIHADAMEKEDFYKIKAGLVSMFSIGFRTLDCEYKEVGDRCVFYITKSLLFEISVVSIPCNSHSGFSIVKSVDGGFTADAYREMEKQTTHDEGVLSMKVKAPLSARLDKDELERLKGLGVDVEAEVDVDLVDLIKGVCTISIKEAVTSAFSDLKAELTSSKAAEEAAAAEAAAKAAEEAAAAEAAAKAAEEAAAAEETKEIVDSLTGLREAISAVKSITA